MKLIAVCSILQCMEPDVLLLTTGGTIDDLEYGDEADAPKGRESIIPSLLIRAGIRVDGIRIEHLMLKDSAFITESDRRRMAERIRAADEERVVITHGTNTMSETAKFLGKSIAGKAVVLTGCMALPSSDGGKDAIASLAFAFDTARMASPGVWVAMGGKVFPWDNVRKNIEKGEFEFER